MKKITISALILSLFVSTFAIANEVNIFNARHYKADAELYGKFTAATGIKVTGTTATGSVFLGDFRVKNTDDSNFVTFKPAENLVRWHDNDKAVLTAQSSSLI